MRMQHFANWTSKLSLPILQALCLTYGSVPQSHIGERCKAGYSNSFLADETHQEQLGQRIRITTIIVNTSQSYMSKLHYKKNDFEIN